MKKLLLFAFLAFAVISCKNRPGEEQVKVQEVALAAPPEPGAADKMISPEIDAVEAAPANTPNKANTVANKNEKKIIKEGEISLEADDLKAARNKATQLLSKLGGYIDEENQNNNTYADRKSYTLKTRIPAQNFERFLNEVSSAADRVESKSIRIKDVTTEFIDVSTRLNNKKLLENRYKELLAKAGKMADILEVENKLNEIRTDIETTQGQLNYLNKQIAYSSLEITFFTKSTDKSDGSGFGYKLKSAFGDSWDLLESLFFGLITLWPVIALLVIGILLFKAWRKRRAKKIVQ